MSRWYLFSAMPSVAPSLSCSPASTPISLAIMRGRRRVRRLAATAITCSNSVSRCDEEGPVPIAATDEQLALQASIRDWAKRAGPVALVRSLEPGPDAGGADG